MKRKLLTIAIPTWNRADFLYGALSHLLPQIVPYSNLIEVIISDNHSDDATPEIIETAFNNNPHIQILHFRQEFNTGYFGNFKKCRELSTGKYFWLLSDNEYVGPNIIREIICILQRDMSTSIIFLKDWVNLGDYEQNEPSYSSLKLSFPDLLKQPYVYRITLISACVLLNDKSDDQNIFSYYHGNSFLGLLFLFKGVTNLKTCYIISGPALFCVSAPVSFNIFESFTVHLIKCTNFALAEKIVDMTSIEQFYFSVHKHLTRWHYFKLKTRGKLYGNDYNGYKSVGITLTQYFFNYPSYNLYLRPFIVCPKLVLQSYGVLLYIKKRFTKKYFLRKTKAILNLPKFKE